MTQQEPQLVISRQQAAAAVPIPSTPRQRLAVQPSLWLSVGTLWLREIRGFYRQRSRVIGALATPAVFWLLLGSGFGTSLRSSTDGDLSYLEFFFPGAVTLVVLFTAIFSNISVIEDRREGFLLSVLVAPVSRAALVLGKILGATTLGVLQGLVFLPLAPLMGISVDLWGIPGVLATILLLAFGLTGLGFFFAWWLNSVQGFHSIMNVVLMPMWLLSGAVFPIAGASAWVRWVMKANPLTYGITAMRHFLSPKGSGLTAPSLEACLIVMCLFSCATLGAAFYQANRQSPEILN